MKNPNKQSKPQLSLQRETIRKLDDQALNRVVGGACESMCGDGESLTAVLTSIIHCNA